MAQTTVAINLEAKTKGTESVKSLKTQIREATQEATALAQKFGEFSPEAINAAKRVAELKDEMQDFQQRVQALNPDKFETIGKLVGGVANGIQAAQGAMALFGAESEDVQKALLKVQGAMAFAQGIQGVIDAKKQFQAFGQTIVGAFNAMSTASKAFLAAGIGLLITGISMLVENWEELTGALTSTEKAQKDVNKTMAEANANVSEQVLSIQYYQNILNDTTKSESERLIALKELQKLVPTLTDNDLKSANALAKINEEIKAYINNATLKAQIDALISKKAEVQNKILEVQGQTTEELAGGFMNSVKAYLLSSEEYDAAFQKEMIAIDNKHAALKDLTATNDVLDKQLKQLTSQYLSAAVTVDKYAVAAESADKKIEKSGKEKKAQQWNREAVFLANIKAGLEASEKVDQEAADKKQRRETAMREYRIEKAFEELELNKKLAEEQIQLEQRKEEAIQQARLNGLQGAASVLDALAGLMKQGSDAQKAFALAAIAADSAKAVVATIVEARNTAKNLTQMGVPPPFPQVAAGAVYASGIAMVLNNVKRAKDVLNGGNISAGGGVGGIPPAAPSFAPTAGGALPDEQQFGGMGRVYVLEGDITKTQTRVRRLRNTSVV
jgi:hypothetical protein